MQWISPPRPHTDDSNKFAKKNSWCHKPTLQQAEQQAEKKPASSSLREGKGEQLLLHSPPQKNKLEDGNGKQKTAKFGHACRIPPDNNRFRPTRIHKCGEGGTQRDGRRRTRRRSTRKDQKHVYGRASVRMSLREGGRGEKYVYSSSSPRFSSLLRPPKKVKHAAGRRLKKMSTQGDARSNGATARSRHKSR